MVDFGRIQKELREIENDKASGVEVQLVSDNLQRLVGSVPGAQAGSPPPTPRRAACMHMCRLRAPDYAGPKDTPYDGGVFKVDIQLDDQYPFVPPKMKFTTRVWHPNVSSQSGAICLDVSGASPSHSAAVARAAPRVLT